jgi:phage FluMu gp28-like protein
MFLLQETNSFELISPFLKKEIEQSVKNNTDKIQIWASSFNDIGDDFCEVIFLDKDNKKIHKQTIKGY